jgi:hypothetical protein
VTITLGTAAFLLPAGVRLRLALACADFPRLWPSAVNPDISVWSGGRHPSALRVPVCATADRRDTPAAIPVPPRRPDPGWVAGGEPVYQVTQDKAAGEVAVTFGATARLRPPSGAGLELDERFTARVRPDRPDGATLTAAIGIGVRLPGGERVEVAVHSVSTRTSTAVEGRVTLDGASLLHHRWTNAGPPDS